jgi:hypothetical protein
MVIQAIRDRIFGRSLGVSCQACVSDVARKAISHSNPCMLAIYVSHNPKPGHTQIARL